MKDEFAGQGGSYTVDKKTGKRALRERTGETAKTEPAKKKPAVKEADNAKADA